MRFASIKAVRRSPWATDPGVEVVYLAAVEAHVLARFTVQRAYRPPSVFLLLCTHFAYFGEAIELNRYIVELLARVGERKGATSGQVALTWLLSRKPWIVPIPGTTSISHMEENLGAAGVHLSDNDLAELDRSFAAITIDGKRAPDALMAVHDIGANFGTSSVGTHGNSPLGQNSELSVMDTNRLEAFSDGVFAIAITLLVLDIKVPHSGAPLGDQLLHLWPSYFAYAVSFIVIGAIWLNHHVIFRHIIRADHQLLLLNTFHLMFIAFLPFPTAVLADALHNRAEEAIATAFYGGTLTVIGLLVIAIWYYAAHEHRLLTENISREEAKRFGRRLLVGPASYAIGSLIALAVPWLALAIYVGINGFFLWPRRSRVVLAE